MTDETTTSETARAPLYDEIPLDTPIQRGATTIDALRLRKPSAGELRGLKLQELLQADVNALIALLPRIAEPKITGPEAEALGLADLAAIGGVVMGFFMSKTDQATMARFMGATEVSTH